MVIHEYSLATFTMHGNYITYELVTMCALWETSCMLTYAFVAAHSDDVSNPYLRPLPQVDKARPEECDSTLRFTIIALSTSIIIPTAMSAARCNVALTHCSLLADANGLRRTVYAARQ